MTTQTENDSELEKLRNNNRNLAQLLAKEQRENQELIEEKYKLQKRLHAASVLLMRYQNVLETVSANTKQILRLSEETSQLTANLFLEDIECNTSKSERKRHFSPINTNKTRAVQPMVGGHVIQRPIINLRRITCTKHEDTQTQTETNPVNSEVNERVDTLNAVPERINETEENRFTLFTNGQPIQPLHFSDFESDPEEEQQQETNDYLTEAQNIERSNLIPVVELENIQCNLSVIPEESSPSVTHDNSSPTEKSPISRSSSPKIDKRRSFTLQEANKSSNPASNNLNYDPLEGSSTTYGYYHNRQKPRRYRHYLLLPSDSDSDDSEDWTPIERTSRRSEKKKQNKLKDKKPVVLLEQISQTSSTEMLINGVSSDNCPSKENGDSPKRRSEKKIVDAPHITKRRRHKKQVTFSDSELLVPLENGSPDKSHLKEEFSGNESDANSSLDKPKRRRKVTSLKEPSLRCRLRR